MTLVSHDHRFIFLETRKTAGTSVEMYLQPFCTPPGTPVEEWGEAIVSKHGIVGQRLGKKGREAPPPPGVERNVWFSHQDCEDLRSKLPADVWKTYEKITVVRNPFAKVLSGYFWRNRKVKLPEDPEENIARFRKTLTTGNRITDDHEIVFARNKLRFPVFQPTIVLRMENLRNDLETLAERLGLDRSRTELPVTKSSGRAPGVIPMCDWYDTETANIVRDRLDWMFTAGGYPREVPE